MAREVIQRGEVDQKARKRGTVYGDLENVFLKRLAQLCSRAGSMFLDRHPWGMKRGDLWAKGHQGVSLKDEQNLGRCRENGLELAFQIGIPQPGVANWPNLVL